MARNEEKRFTLMNKWHTFKAEFHATGTDKRPVMASDCESVGEAERWRRELVRDITKKIAAIKNASLGEPRIRELNDEINKMMRQKHHWEMRIKELGGNVPQGKQYYDIEGKELPGAPGYKYYGAAKDLPGVRELFAEQDEETKQRKVKKRTRGEIHKHITPDYYGYRDEDDGILLPLEKEREREMREENGVGEDLQDEDEEFLQLQALRTIGTDIMLQHSTSNPVLGVGGSNPVGSAMQEEKQKLEEALMEKKKMALLSALDKY
ncbi:hypothetical protein EON65_25915 [archaeon]|nr:MAG: hypothetical protein EON65_25915 [archaeon]